METTAIVIPDANDLGKIGIKQLKRYWAKGCAFREKLLNEADFHDEINIDTILLSVLGLGLEQTLRHWYSLNDFNEFEDWILDINGGRIDSAKVARFNALFDGAEAVVYDAGEQVLSDADLDFFNEHGYVILRNAITKEDAAATLAVVCDFLNVDINDPATWYTANPARQGIMVQLFQHSVLQKNRDAERIRKAYGQLLGRSDIWVNVDRVGFNPPETGKWKFPGPRLHWDVSLELPIPFGLQGILYLSDTQANQGAFSLIPGFHNKIEDWINSLPQGCNPRTENLYELGVIPVVANAGDFIIWHHALPHGSSPNTSALPRIVQYINYLPVDAKILKKWL